MTRGTCTFGHTKISHKEDCCEKTVVWNACFLPHAQPSTVLLSGRSVATHDNEIYLRRSYSSILHFIYCNLMGLASKPAICVVFANDNKIAISVILKLFLGSTHLSELHGSEYNLYTSGNEYTL